MRSPSSIRLLRGLATLLDLGFPLAEALERLLDSSPAPLKSPLQEAVSRVRAGATAAQALQPVPGLPQALFSLLARDPDDPAAAVRLAAGMEQEQWERSRAVKQALAYPELALYALLLLGGLLFCVLGPAFMRLYAEMNLELPLPTLVLLAVVRSPLTPVALVTGLVLVRLVLSGWSATDGLRLRLPLLGSWLVRQQTLLWLGWLESLMSRGVGLAEALSGAAGACTSPVFRRRMTEVAESVARGDTLALALGRQPLFPAWTAWLLGLAEGREFAAGDLAGVRQALRVDMERSFQRGLPALEPLLLIVLGATMGWYAAANFLPLYRLLGNL